MHRDDLETVLERAWRDERTAEVMDAMRQVHEELAPNSDRHEFTESLTSILLQYVQKDEEPQVSSREKLYLMRFLELFSQRLSEKN